MKESGICLQVICIVCILVTISGCSSPAENNETIFPTSTPPPGWNHFSANTVDVWLPEPYYERDITEITPGESESDTEDEFLFYAVEDMPDSMQFLSSFVIGRQPMQDELSFTQYQWFYKDNLPENYHGISYEEIASPGYPMAKLTFRIDNSSAAPLIQTVYLISVGNFLYKVVFTTSSDNYPAEKVNYAQIINALQIAHHGDTGLLGENSQGIGCLAIIFVIIAAILIDSWLKRRRRKFVSTPIILPEDF